MKDKRYLTQTKQFTEVFRRGSSRVSNLLVLRTLPNGLNFTRYGFTISRKTGGAAIRNRLKRRQREIMRALNLLPGWDMVILARPAAAESGFSELKSALLSLLCRAELIIKNEELCLKAD